MRPIRQYKDNVTRDFKKKGDGVACLFLNKRDAFLYNATKLYKVSNLMQVCALVPFASDGIL